MATTFVDYTGDGNATKAFSFPSIKEADVKVDVDGVLKTASTHYNITSYTTTGGGNVVFTSGNIPASPAAIRIFRDTDVDSAKATYTAGSSVKAGDLNNNNTQLLYAAQEEQNQTILSSDIKDGAITTAKILDSNVTTAKIADNAITSAKFADNSVSMAKLAGGTLPSDIAVNSANITDLTVATGDIANDAVTADKLANTSVSAGTYTAADITVDAQGRLTSAASGTIATSEIAADAITGAKIADDAVDSEHIAADSLDTEHYAPISIDSAAIASNAVITSKITDANVTTTKIADSNVTLAKLASDLKQTTISDSDTQLPTSGAVVDYVAAQLEPFGGFEAIANEVSFPNTQPASGVAISIADAAGIVVNGSNTSTTGRTVGGTTVTINNISSQFTSSTISSGVRFIVTSTGSGHVYNYHKATLPESDLANLSGDINDFNERYRVGGSNPSSSLDGGDLFFNTTTGKLLVYNNTTSAWEEAQSIGNFFISTLSPAFDGTTQDFTISNPPTSAQQIILSINGVVQKPNAGSSTPSEGFALSSGTIKLSAAPATGSTYHAVVMGSTVNIGTPSNNTVTSAILQDNAVTTAKIADANVTTAKIADESITLAKLAHGTSSNNGKFLRANNGADPTFETVDLTGFVQSTGGTFTGLIYTHGGIQLGSSDTIKFDSDDSDTNHISVQGPLSLSSTVTYTLPEDGSNGQFLTTNGSGVLSFADASSPEVYGFKTTGSELQVTTTNGGADNISGTTFDTFEDVVLAATGFSFSVNANGKLIATI